MLSQNYGNNNGPNAQPSAAAQIQKIPAVDFTAVDGNKKPVKLSGFFGKPIVMNFWASWCPPCKRELPAFNTLYEEMKEDINFIMLDLVDGQQETFETGKEFIINSGYTFPVYYDLNGEANYIYRITSIPITAFIDREGNIVKIYRGSMTEDTLRGLIELIK